MRLIPLQPCARASALAALLACCSVAPAFAQEQEEVQTQEPVFDPAAPMADMPDFGVEWPDLENMPDLPEGETPDQPVATEITGERRYAVRIEGIEKIESDVMRARFKELSTLEKGKDKPANAAQIDRRAREDEELLETLLRAAGYYDAQIDTKIETEAGGRVLVILKATPGEIYRFTDVEVRGLDNTGAKADELRKAFPITENDPVDADKVIAAEGELRTKIGREGFPFAKVTEPEVVVDHEDRTAKLVLDVDPGTLRKFGKVTMADEKVFSAKHVQRIGRFKPGDTYDAADIDDLRRALIQTGLVSSAKVEPVPGATPDTVDVAVAVEPAPARTIAGELGYGTGEGVRLEASWQHRNFIKPEGALTVRGVAGTQEQLFSVQFRRNNFMKRDRVLNSQISARHIDSDAYDARTFAIAGSLERQTNIIFQKKWTWSLGAELIASNERGREGSTTDTTRRTYFIGALPSSLSYDGSDDLLNPGKGFRLSGRVSPEGSFQDGTFGYVKAQVDASGYFPVSDRVVLAARTRLGTIVGADRDRIAPSRRYYAGGGGSVRGYSYQSIGPRDAENNPIGGKGLAEFSLEARFRLGNFGIVPFLDAGSLSTDSTPDFGNMRFGAGIGGRYYTNFGPIRVDVGTPLNPQPGDPKITVYVSLGQAF